MKKYYKGKKTKKKFTPIEEYKIKEEQNKNLNNNNQINEESKFEEKINEKKEENIETKKPDFNTPNEDNFFNEMNKNSEKIEQKEIQFSNSNADPKIELSLELNNLMQKNQEELINYFSHINIKEYKKLVNGINDEEIFILINILRKIIENDSKEAINIIYKFIENTPFFKIYINKFIQDSNNCSIQCLHFINDYVLFYNQTMNYFYENEKYKKLPLFKESFIEVMTKTNNNSLKPLCFNINQMFNLIKDKEKAYFEEQFFGLKFLDNHEKKK